MESDTDPAARLIVALDVPDVPAARRLIQDLDGTVRFFKIGMWLLYQRETNALVDELVAAGHRVFLDAKMYDIGETVRHGVASLARRGISILTIHGDPGMMRAAVDGRGDSAMKLFAISVLTSQDQAALTAMGYDRPLSEIVDLRVRHAAECGCDGIIASAADGPDAIRSRCGRPDLLVATPGIRLAGQGLDDQKRAATPDEAIRRGADYLVVGRPITQAANPRAVAEQVLSLMREGGRQRHAAA